MKKPMQCNVSIIGTRTLLRCSLWWSRKKEVKEVTFADSAGYLALTLLIRPTKFSQIKDVQKFLLIIGTVTEYFYRTLASDSLTD